MNMNKIVFLFAMVFLGTVVSAQTTVPIGYKDLPKDAQKYVTQHYQGYAVGTVTEGRNPKGKPQYYDVHVSKDAENMVLVFDKDGDFVKHHAAAGKPKSASDSAHKN